MPARNRKLRIGRFIWTYLLVRSVVLASMMVLTFDLFNGSAYGQQTEIAVTKLTSFAGAGHSIFINTSCGASDGGGFEDDDEVVAVASSLDAPKGAACSDPDCGANAKAYQIAIAGSGPDNELKVSLFKDIFAHNEPGSWAISQIHLFQAGANATWDIDIPAEDPVWIESDILILAAAGPGPGSGGLIDTYGASAGDIAIRDTYIQYDSDEIDNVLRVWGTIMDLDGPHYFDITTTQPFVALKARQFIDESDLPLPTSVGHGGGATVYANQSEGNYGQGLVGEIFTRATLHAFTGSPNVQPGDYNVDGNVDAADYVLWRKSVGSPHLPNSNGLGTVGQAHYDLWLANFGASNGGGESIGVPEPATLCMVIIGVALSRLSRRRC